MNAAPELEEPRHVLRKRFSLKQVLCGLGELHFNRAQSSFLLSGKGWRPTCWMFKLSQDRQFKGNASNSTHDELQKNPNIFAELGGYLLGFQMTWWAPKGPKQVHSQDIEMANLKVFPSSPWVELNWNLQNFWTWWAPKGPKFSSFTIKVKQWDGSLCPDNESRKQLIDKTVRVLPGLNPAS